MAPDDQEVLLAKIGQLAGKFATRQCVCPFYSSRIALKAG
jgi:hypothetical protein